MPEETTPEAKPLATKPTGLALLRQPVEKKYIAWLPKPTRAQTEAVKNDFKAGRRCDVCGTWHHPDVQHLAYTGHAGTTARLLEVDETWNWEPLALDVDGLPKLDATGGLWIRMTVAGVTRLGYGHADTKPNADAGAQMKEKIGDAIRNAAMRFGWALDLWHKGGDLFTTGFDGEDDEPPAKTTRERDPAPASDTPMKEGRASAKESSPKKEALPAYTAKQLADNLPAWTKAFEDGSSTAESVINKIQTRYTLTAKQRADIKAAGIKAAQKK